MQILVMSDGVRKAIALVVSLTIIAYPIQTFAVPSFPDSFTQSSVNQTRDSTGLTALPKIDVKAINASMWELEGRAYEIAEEFAASRFRFDDVLDALSYDAEEAFHFVRDSVRLDPYEGVLRDAEGVLGGRAGNAYDRSLLLKKLLEDMGFEARLVFGTLEPKYIGALLNRAMAPVNNPDDILPLAQLAGLSSEMRSRMSDRAKRDFSWLKTALEGKRDGHASIPVEPDMVRNHVWVQAKLESDWEDLDSSFPNAEPGDVFASVVRYASDATESDRHVVQIKVVAETLENGKLVEHELLTHQMLAPDATRARTYLAFTPMNAGVGGALATALGPEIDYVPVLMIDGKITAGKRIPGAVGHSSDGKDFLYGASKTELIGMYIDVRVGLANSLGKVSRGVLIDRLPSLLRVSGRPAKDNLKPMPMNGDQPEGFRGIHQIMVSNGGSNPRTVSADVGLAFYFVGKYLTAPGALDELSLDATMWPAAMFRNAQVAVNERLLDVTLNDSTDMRFFIGEPRVYVMSQILRSSGDDARVGLSVDLLHDPIHVIATDHASAKELHDHRLWHGVVQSSFETTLVELPKITNPDTAKYTLSTSTESTGPSVLFSDRADDRLPEKTPFVLRQDIAEGKVVVASSKSFDDGLATWWAVGPDGTTRAMVEPAGGYGVTMWEGFRNLRLPSQSLFSAPTFDATAEAYSRGLITARDAYRGEAVRRTANPAPRTSRGGGGTEYAIVLNISLYSAIGAAGILGLVIVALAIGGMLYVLGYVWITERQRRERGY
jgi:transglutaminase-like putative cysteine protease